ncbi:hypothetical protein [Marinobacter caseinilyticus]|uniref:hypothetical protein n=1 Tax=Marinobacter caseinilyticus TaxID=2692195 RepID=UPI00140B6944|nr:hypothetical protein [Marinobacter caseinilyticus]
MSRIFRYPLALITVLVLSACTGPETPQEVTEAFWHSVIENDAGDATELSTLTDEADFDGFARDWQDVTVSWGRVVIDGDEASIVTTLDGLGDGDGDGDRDPVQTATYLTRQNQQWLVDHRRTGDALADRPMFDQVMRQLGDLGDKFRARFSESSDDAAREMERMAEELERKMTAADQQFSRTMEAFGEQLEKALDELSQSIEDALKDQPSASPDDRRTLNQAVIRLDQNREQLGDETDLRSISQGSKALAETQLSLNSVGREFEDYKIQWQRQMRRIEKDMARFMDEL